MEPAPGQSNAQFLIKEYVRAENVVTEKPPADSEEKGHVLFNVTA